MSWPDAEFPADPYPGAVPPSSFVHLDEVSHPLRPDPRAGWILDDDAPLDSWLAGHGAAPAAARIPVLTYGSNRCPSKISWLRRELGLGPEPVVVLRAGTRDVAAVWASGLRHRDGQRPAVLAASPGTVEDHAVWLATPEQIAVLDRCEGRDDRFRLARLRTGEVRLEDQSRVDVPWCYLGLAATRRPLLVDGVPVRCADLPQEAAVELTGDAAPGDGLDADTVHGDPHADEWPGALFTYGLLRPGDAGWHRVAPYLGGDPQRGTVNGTVLDTGRGFPALLPGTGDRAPGWLVPLRDPAAVLPTLDDYEGPEYRRVRVAAAPGRESCWVYVWCAPSDGMPRLTTGWPPPS